MEWDKARARAGFCASVMGQDEVMIDNDGKCDVEAEGT